MNRAIHIVTSAVLLCGSGCPLVYDLDGVVLETVEDMVVEPDAGDTGEPRDMPRDMEEVVDLDDGDAEARDLGGDMAADMMADDMSGDTGSDAAMPADMADMTADMGPFGQTCPNPVPLDGTCSLVDQDCNADQICEVVLTSNGPVTGCSTIAIGTTYTLMKGDSCDPVSTTKCAPGLRCRIGTCVAYCDLEDGRGCEIDEFCAPFDANALPGVGFCASACP